MSPWRRRVVKGLVILGSLLAFLVSLPLAFLALVPSGAVGAGLDDVIKAISFVFPFKATLQALDAAVNGASPSLGARASRPMCWPMPTWIASRCPRSTSPRP